MSLIAAASWSFAAMCLSAAAGFFLLWLGTRKPKKTLRAPHKSCQRNGVESL